MRSAQGRAFAARMPPLPEEPTSGLGSPRKQPLSEALRAIGCSTQLMALLLASFVLGAVWSLALVGLVIHATPQG